MRKAVNGVYGVLAKFKSGKLFKKDYIASEVEARAEANRCYKMGATEITLYEIYYRSKGNGRYRTSKELQVYIRKEQNQ